ncbi:Tip elongation aberrant 1 [Fusarium albosuccineum]|uniref:Tip elongation aberrant 1 n=1 Tax=Fusarium albosuccineum TaxID=1237068 RepID=A0A8H4L5U3_9HYPO|nr:Tip elongation aberrant 1 [Fusarium albosuccineum]
MADSGRSSDKSPLKTRVVRPQKPPGAPAVATPNFVDDDSDDDESSDHTPLPRSHTPGHLASKSIQASRRKPSDLSIRQRSQSTSQGPSQPHASSASRSTNRPPPALSNGAGDGSSEGDRHPRRPSAMRSTSAITSRTTAQASARYGSHAPRPVRGECTAFPPLPDPRTAPDVPVAPASGMYWSKAPVSGAPHTSLRAHTTTIIGSNVFVFGGCDSRTCFNDLYVLDADSFHWSIPHVVGDIPVPLRAMTCTAVGKKLIVFGGGDGPEYYNDVYVLDTTNFRWSKPRIIGDKMPSKRRAHTACLYKNGIYVFGGGDGVRALNDIWRLDVTDVNKMSWRLVSSPDKTSPGAKDYRPKARGYHTANMVGSKLIIFGGSDGGECFDDVWVYDVETQVWRAVPIPVAFRRLSHTATIVGSYLFVIGGHDGNEYSNDVLLLNLVTMTWDKRRVYGKAPSGRGYHGTVLYDSRLIVIGGFDGSEVFGDAMLLELAVHAYYSQISHFTIEV